MLFDLDGVLLRGDTMAHLVKTALARRPWRMPAALALLLCARAVPGHSCARAASNRALVRLALRGVPESHYLELVADTAHRLSDTSADQGLIDEAIAHRASGARVLVVTATERSLAEAYLSVVGLEDVEVLASSISFRQQPRLDTHNVGPAKVEAARQAGADLSSALLYTDSSSDLPLMRAVREVVLVNPGRSTQRAVRRAKLAAGVRLVRG